MRGNKQLRQSVLFLLTLSVFFSLQERVASAYQFEDYSWGTSKDQMAQTLGQRGKSIKITADLLGYKDNILDFDCLVMLSFSPSTKLLSQIYIKWDVDVGDSIYSMLVQKYGSPSFGLPGSYRWGDTKTGSDEIILRYTSSETKLIYSSGYYYHLMEKEKDERNSRTIERF